jgi:signal transduction histidine kinase
MSGSGGSGSARSGTQRLTLSSLLLAPLDPSTWRAFLAVIIGPFVTLAAAAVLMILWSTGGSLIVVLVGIPIIGLGIEASRLFARAERWRMELVDQRPLPAHAYRALDYSPSQPYDVWLRAYAEGQFLDLNRWRDVVYAVLAFPMALLECVVVIGLWSAVLGLAIATLVLVGEGEASASLVTGALCLALTPVAAFVTRGVATIHRLVVETLLCVDQSEALRQDVERLRTSRSAAVELEASELRRIERDLHDGAQQRLVMLAMDLGRAESKIDSDPVAARRLVADARVQSQAALAELRSLVRGTAPSILVDRGLAAAVASIAATTGIPTVVDGRRIMGQRFHPAVERAAYFVASEALTNVAKHSLATRSDVVFWRDASRLVVDVWDDGRGGAAIAAGGGLAGLRDRVATLDGSLDVTSPPGGPTLVRAFLPLSGGRA